MDFEEIDRLIARFMNNWGTPCLRISLGIIFIWFGILKPFGISPAENLVLKTVSWIPLFESSTWLDIIGWWEVAIGACFLWRKTLRVAIALLVIQMAGTFLPLILLPSVTFQAFPYAPTMEGQYILKNILIISAALVIGGTVHKYPR